MSTKAIRMALEEMKERLEDALEGPPFSRDQSKLDKRRLEDVKDALAEVEAIEKAAKEVVGIGGQKSELWLATMALMESIAKEAP